MDPFEQADATVQVCSGIFGIVLIVVFVYFSIFRKNKEKKK